MLNFRFHILKVGKDIVPYKPIASRIRSKSLKQGIQEHVKCQIDSPVGNNEYMDFLTTLLTQKDITPSNKALSTSSSSGSSIIRMVKDSPDSPDTVLPGSTSTSSCLIDEPVSLQESSQCCLLLDSASSSVFENGNVIQALPGYTTVINEDVQVS